MDKKTIKVKYVGFWNGFDPTKVVFTNIILQNYNVVECDDPDYILCSCFGDEDYYEYCKYDQVRIMFSGENYIPDFNLIDYAVSTYPIAFQDRHFQFPLCFEDYNGRFASLIQKKRNYDKSIVNQKDLFANFIVSHESESGLREEFFTLLNEYKRVESVGTYMNNQKDNFVVDLSSKPELQKRCKFTLCFESTKHEGFVTEKITDAFFADTIPVYYGSRDVKKYFNEEAFIYCSGRDDFENTIKRVIEIDQNDDLFLDMLKKPIFNDKKLSSCINEQLTVFINHIFNQPLDQAFRRSRVYAPKRHEWYILRLKKIEKSLLLGRAICGIDDKQVFKSLLKRLKRIIKKIIKRNKRLK